MVSGRYRGGRSLLGVEPVRTVPAGGDCTGVYHGTFGVPTFSGDLVIVEMRRRRIAGKRDESLIFRMNWMSTRRRWDEVFIGGTS
jgi:hypothetical protein